MDRLIDAVISVTAVLWPAYGWLMAYGSWLIEMPRHLTSVNSFAEKSLVMWTLLYRNAFPFHVHNGDPYLIREGFNVSGRLALTYRKSQPILSL